MTKEYEICPICYHEVNSIYMENHHYIPESLGGTLKNTIRICGTCHDVIHYYIPIEEISNYRHISDIIKHPIINKYIDWIYTRKNTGHIPIKKILRKFKVSFPI